MHAPHASRCIVSRANVSVLVPTTGRSATIFPSAPCIDYHGAYYLVVPHDLPSTVALRVLGYKVPNPMNCYYDWCGGEPFAVQKSTCDLFTSNPRSYCLNAMGTGKTKCALWAWDYLRSNGLCGKLLVVATLSTLYVVWGKEVFDTIPHRKFAILHGDRKKRLALLNSDAEIFVINHDGLRTIQADIEARTDIDTLVLDELAVYRNNSQRSKSMRRFAQRFQRVWGLTGAPMPNAPTDVWAQAKIVTPENAPKYFKAAEEMMMNRVNKFTLVPKPDAVKTAFNMLQPSVRYQLDDVVELPEVVHHTLDIPLTKEQKDAYDKLKKAFQIEIQKKTITAVNAAVAMGKLLQISGGWVYAGDQTVSLDNSPRLDTLTDLVCANERKVLIFVPYIHSLEGVVKVLEKAGVETAVVHGGVSGGERADIFRLFQQTDKYKALVAHPTCLAHGLTLTAADTIIWFLPTTSLDIYDQANARISRVGQKHKQKVYHLQSTAVEKKIYTLLKSKANIQNDLLTMLAEATAEA